MLFENNTALGYDIAWDNALTNIFYNLRYSFMQMEVPFDAFWSNGLVVKARNSQSSGSMFKTTG